MPTSSESLNELAALQLLEEAMERRPPEREAYIAGRDDRPPAVRERALALLMSDRDAMAALRTGGAGAGLYGSDDVAPDIGGYRIKRQLGRGGMGSVWLAERDKSDFEHDVAIKVIRPGALSDSLIERFRRERQILARLNHPHIARLYDGGETEEGQPYIVMEHVPGQTLRDWLRQTPAPTLARKLALFHQIAAAVAFAHQNLIVHRDLTPGNVLVDSREQAKLIDFGIARPPRAGTERSPSSRVTGLSLTPGFAAPERALGEASNTLSDIYSLGRMLDALLGENSPPELAAVAARAAAHAPEDRYQSVTDLIDDLDRYSAGRTVAAFSTSRRYRVGKFVRRQRALVGSLAALVLVLTGGLAASSWSYVRAQEAREQAERRFGEVRELANFMLFELYDQLEPVPGNTRSLTSIANRASGYLDTLAGERDADWRLRFETANGFKRLSNVLGNPEGSNLGRREEAGVALKRAVAMLETLHRERPEDLAIARALGQALYSQSVYLFIAQDDSEGAIGPARRSAALFGGIANGPDARPQDIAFEIEAQLQALKPLVWIAEGKQAIAGMEALTRKAAALATDHPGSPEIRKARARATTQLASAMSWTYDVDKEAAEYRRSIPVADRAVAMYADLVEQYPNDRELRFGQLTSLFTRALIHYDLENWEASHRDLAEAERRGDTMLAQDPDDSDVARRLQTYRSQHAPILVELGREEEGIAMAARVLSERNALLASEPGNPGYLRDRASAQALLGETLFLSGRDREGCRATLKATQDWQKMARITQVGALNIANDVEPLNKTVRKCRADKLL